jgi:hypothetical protein
MRCRRCQGLMVVDYFTDMRSGGEPLWLRAWRCINCGEVAESGITDHRLMRRSRVARFFGRLKHRPSRTDDVVPLGI